MVKFDNNDAHLLSRTAKKDMAVDCTFTKKEEGIILRDAKTKLETTRSDWSVPIVSSIGPHFMLPLISCVMD